MDYIVTQNGELVTTDELYHWGIKGMKWGIRRYQNKDGSLTPLGKKRVEAKSNNEGAVNGELTQKEYHEELNRRELARMSKLSGKGDHSPEHRARFGEYVEAVQEELWWEKQNPDVRKNLKNTVRSWIDNELKSAKEEDDEWRDFGEEAGYYDSAKKFFDTYASNVDAFAKALVDTADEYNLYVQDKPLILKEYDDDLEHSELYHWGIKGMKWGRRLYQNKDGSLTPLGKKRYAREEAQLKEREKSIKAREREAAKRAKLDSKRADLDAREEALNGSAKGKKSDAPAGVKKNIKDMSDEELNQAIQRARMEDAYRQLRPDPVAKPGLGKRLVDEVAIPALMSSGRKAVESIIDKSVKDLLKDKVDPNSLAGIEAANKKLRAKIENDLLKRGIDPNLKGENLEKWKTFNDKIKAEQDAAEQVKKDAKQAKKDAKEAERKAWDDRFNSENETVDAAYESVKDNTKTGGGRKGQKWEKKSSEPEVTVEGVGTSRRNKEEPKKTRNYDIIDADGDNLPSIIRRDVEYAKSSSDNLPVVSYSHTPVSAIQPRLLTTGKDYIDSVDWSSLSYSGKSSSGNRVKDDVDIDQVNREMAEKWMEELRRNGLI